MIAEDEEDDTPRFPCALCSKVFKYEQVYVKHVPKCSAKRKLDKQLQLVEPRDLLEVQLTSLDEPDQENGKFSCTQCGLPCASSEKLMEHMEDCVEKKAEFSCDSCGREFVFEVNNNSDSEID